VSWSIQQCYARSVAAFGGPTIPYIEVTWQTQMLSLFLRERNNLATTASRISCNFPIDYIQAYQALSVN
jgi:hypothetical protein